MFYKALQGENEGVEEKTATDDLSESTQTKNPFFAFFHFFSHLLERFHSKMLILIGFVYLETGFNVFFVLSLKDYFKNYLKC